MMIVPASGVDSGVDSGDARALEGLGGKLGAEEMGGVRGRGGGGGGGGGGADGDEGAGDER